MNETNWQVFYGHSGILNRFLNWPLAVEYHHESHQDAMFYILRFLIIGQWAMTVGSAAVKDWNAYSIALGVVICIVTQSYVLPPNRSVRYWRHNVAKLQFEKYCARLRLRRALLSAIIALNPDTHTAQNDNNLALTETPEHLEHDDRSMRWIDPILKQGPERRQWQDLTRRAIRGQAKLGHGSDSLHLEVY